MENESKEPLAQETQVVQSETVAEPESSPCPPIDSGTLAFQEARDSVIAELQPQIDALRAENETLSHTVEQYKKLLKGTVRSESAQEEVPKPVVLPRYQAMWRKKGN